jgi:hypothetical protein
VLQVWRRGVRACVCPRCWGRCWGRRTAPAAGLGRPPSIAAAKRALTPRLAPRPHRSSQEHVEKDAYPPPTPDAYLGLKPYYWLDFASVLPPLLLGVQPGASVLDMCAAPGGKSLVLAQQLFKPGVVLQGVVPFQRPPGSAGSQASERSTAAAVGEALQGTGGRVHEEEQQEQQEQQQQQQQQQQGTERVVVAEAEGAGEVEGADGSSTACGTDAGAAAEGQQQQEQQEQQEQQQEQQQQVQGHGTDAAGKAAAGAEVAAGNEEGEVGSADGSEEGEGVVLRIAAAGRCDVTGRLVCNELDAVRRQRLRAVLQEYLPASCRKSVKVGGL